MKFNPEDANTGTDADPAVNPYAAADNPSTITSYLTDRGALPIPAFNTPADGYNTWWAGMEGAWGPMPYAGDPIPAGSYFAPPLSMRGDAPKYVNNVPKYMNAMYIYWTGDTDGDGVANSGSTGFNPWTGAPIWGNMPDPSDPSDQGVVPTGNFGPHCRNCHRGSSDCQLCHEEDDTSPPEPAAGHAAEPNFDMADELELNPAGATARAARLASETEAAQNWWVNDNTTSTFNLHSMFDAPKLYEDGITEKTTVLPSWRHEQTVYWDTDWRRSAATTSSVGDAVDGEGNAVDLDPIINTMCSNDGFSWPHRTMGFKLLKDELWGLDFDGTEVWVGESRDGVASTLDINPAEIATGVIPLDPAYVVDAMDAMGDPADDQENAYSELGGPAEDLDSVCLDCHNPRVWNVQDMGNPDDLWNRLDTEGTTVDDMNDELILRGLP